METLLALWSSVQGFIETHGIAAIAVVLFVEEIGIPSPVPGDLLMLLAGVRVAEGYISLPAMLLIEAVATFSGSSLLYLAARRGGRPLVLRHGRLVGVTPERLALVEAQIAGREMQAVFLGRLVPGLRSLTVLTAGVVNVPPHRFFPAMLLGGLVYLTFFTVVGVIVGPPVLHIFEQVAFPASVLWSLGGLFVIALAVRELRRVDPEHRLLLSWGATYLLGGLVAGMCGLLAANVTIGVTQSVVHAAGGSLEGDFPRSLGEVHFVLGWPVFLAVAAIIGAVYRRFDARRLPVLVRLALTSLLPLSLMAVLTIEPLFELGGLHARPVALLLVGPAAVARWAVFGLMLELLPLDPRDPSR